MDFYKYQALGNDYIIINPQVKLNSARIKLICHRNLGIGSDGILYGPINRKGKIGLRIFNPDSSEAEKSGNGIRIFAKYLYDSKIINQKKFSIQTKGGAVAVELLNGDASLIKVDMGTATYKSDKIPMAGKPREVINEPLTINNQEYRITCLSIGNPHCVIPLKKISEALAKKIGPKIEHHSLFPKRINVQLLQVIDKRNIKIEIWERGVGYTLASGSSSCAAVSAAYKLGLVGRKVWVHMPGGKIEIFIHHNGHIFITGPVTKVCEGNFAKDFFKSSSRLAYEI